MSSHRKDVDQFLAYAAEENLEAVPVAVVTEDPRLVLIWRGKEIVNISRAFLDTNGAHQETGVQVEIAGAERIIICIKSRLTALQKIWNITM